MSACGGGGGDSFDPGPEVPDFVIPAHAPPTLQLNGANTTQVGVETTAVIASLRSLGFQMAAFLDAVPTMERTFTRQCSDGGQQTVTFIDVDSDDRLSAGDKITFDAVGCTVHLFGNGTATVHILAVDSEGVSDAQVDIAGATLQMLAASNWLPSMSGTFRMTLRGDDVWLTSDSGIAFQDVLGGPVLHASRISLTLGLDDVDPPNQGVDGGFDLTLASAVIGSGQLQVDTDGLVAGVGNSAPAPGSVRLRGSAGSRMTITRDSRPESLGYFRFRTDADGNGTWDVDSLRSYIGFYDLLD